MIDLIKKDQCTGCKMCGDICPVNSITYECDGEGFWYPKVDYDKCIKCNKCLKMCPSLNIGKVNVQKKPKVYSVWSKDDNIRVSSTSGGAFYEIARAFIERGGVVVGCTYNNDWKSAYHMIAHNIEELERIKGSKYFQSDTAGIYNEVKIELEQGKKVLFCGTPCQNAALQMYLQGKYSGIYYMDFICRSINSPKAFKAYIEELESQYESKVVNVHLKDKTRGWQSLATRVEFEDGEVSLHDKDDDWWVKGFIYNDLYTRESCYHCQYKKLPRLAADISIGDFWGIEDKSAEDMFKGISVILVNSDNGQKLLDYAGERLERQIMTIDNVIPGNPALLHNPIRTSKQSKFFKLLKKNSFSFSVKKCIKESAFKRGVSKMKRLIRRPLHIIKQLIINPNGVSWGKYVYYNYLCKSVIREGNGKIIPYKNAIINLDKTARIYVRGGNIEIGINKLKNSKAETHVRIENNAVWESNNGCGLFYNTVLEIKANAHFTSGYFTANGGSVIVVAKKITFGEDVMLGRNIIVYDSDFHKVYNKEGQRSEPKEVIIEDHVWLTSNVTVLKGVRIGKDSLITAQTLIRKDFPEKSIISSGASGRVISNEAHWAR